jgi:hypothetical protein
MGDHPSEIDRDGRGAYCAQKLALLLVRSQGLVAQRDVVMGDDQPPHARPVERNDAHRKPALSRRRMTRVCALESVTRPGQDFAQSASDARCDGIRRSGSIAHGEIA